MQVEEFLEISARRFPEKTALVSGAQRLTYREIEERSNQFSYGLIATGVRRGDRVAVYLDNSVEAVLSVFAVLKAGAVFMMVNPGTKAEKLTYVLNNSRAKTLIAQRQKVRSIQSCWRNTPDLETVLVVGQEMEPLEDGEKNIISWEQLVSQHSQVIQPPPKRAIDIDLAALMYTSGSTGNPKGVVMTHLNMVSVSNSIITYLENTPDDIILNALPLSFGYGLYQVLMAFKVGGTVVLERSFTFPHAVLEKMMEERVTGFPIVPTMSAILLQLDLTKYPLPSLRYITNAGAALPVHHIVKLRELLPDTKLYPMYGLTECKRVSYLPPEQVALRPTSVGKAIPNVEVFIVDEQGAQLPQGQVGELVVRGSNVMKGYWERPEETARTLKPGPLPGEKVLYTGDLFRMDEEGYLYWVGRKDDIIKSRGEKISPIEVENALYTLEGVAMAAVIGVPDDVFGQVVKAVITLKEGVHLTTKDILRHCAQHLEEFMVPKLVEFRDAMPKTTSGKIDKREVAALRDSK